MNPSQNHGAPMMFPFPADDNEPIEYMVTIKPGHNGYAVFVEENAKTPRAPKMSDITKTMNHIGKNLQGEDDVARLIRENELKPDPDKVEIKLGMYTFNTEQEMYDFIKFVYEEHNNRINPAPVSKKKDTSKHNSHMA